MKFSGYGRRFERLSASSTKKCTVAILASAVAEFPASPASSEKDAKNASPFCIVAVTKSASLSVVPGSGIRSPPHVRMYSQVEVCQLCLRRSEEHTSELQSL